MAMTAVKTDANCLTLAEILQESKLNFSGLPLTSELFCRIWETLFFQIFCSVFDYY